MAGQFGDGKMRRHNKYTAQTIAANLEVGKWPYSYFEAERLFWRFWKVIHCFGDEYSPEGEGFRHLFGNIYWKK